MREMMFTGDGRIDGFHLYRECEFESAARGLDRLLKLLRWQGLVGLPNEHLVTVNDAAAMRDIALDSPACAFAMTEPDTDDGDGDVAA